MKEFIINKHLSLKLEEESVGELKLDEFNEAKYSLRTNIYVKGNRFRQCKFLLLEVTVNEISSLNKITSIDEGSEVLDHSEEGFNVDGSQRIPPEVEFWGHCSNLQAWYENDYDTRLIHRNLAFPLLKELTDVGDPLAKRVFREEIAQRLESGYLPVVSYLLLEEYTNYLSDEYFEAIAQSQEMIDILFKAVESKNSIFKFVSLYLFHKLYNYLSNDIVQKFVDFIKQDAKYVKNIFYDPAFLTNARWVYYSPYLLFSIRVALILDDMKEEYDSKIDYENLNWNYYLEDILFEKITRFFFPISIPRDLDLEFKRKKFFITTFLKKAYKKDDRLTKEILLNCEQELEEIIKEIIRKFNKIPFNQK